MQANYFEKLAAGRNRILLLALLGLWALSAAASAQRVAGIVIADSKVKIKEKVVVAPNPPVQQRVEIVPEPRDFDASIWTDRSHYERGDRMEVDFRVSCDSYVYIFNTDVEGETRQIFPNYYDRDNFVRAGERVSLPNRDYSLVISGPSGREELELVAVADRYEILADYETYERNAPYPLRSGGPEKMLRDLRSSQRAAPGVKHNEAGVVGAARVDIQPKRVEVVPNRVDIVETHEPEIARAHTSFTVEWPRHEHRFGEVRIKTGPAGANIYLDGDFIGRTPEKLHLPVGHYNLVLTRSGYYDEDISLNVRSGQQTIKAHLQRAYR